MTEKIILYDLASALTPQQWSSNTLKTRLLFNYFEIPYETIWLPYPDITPFLQKNSGLAARRIPQEAYAPYTVPTIDDNGLWVMDSEKILEHVLDKFSIPREKIIPNEEFWQVFKSQFDLKFQEIFVFLAMAYTQLIFDDESIEEYFNNSKLKRVGRNLADVRQDAEYVRDTWNKLVEELKSFSILREAVKSSSSLSEDELFKGEYLYGNKISYADFLLYAKIWWTKVSIVRGMDVEGIDKEELLSPWLAGWFERISKYNY